MYAVYDFASSGSLFFEAPTDLPKDTISFETGNAGGVFLNTVPGYDIKDGEVIQWNHPTNGLPPGATYMHNQHITTAKTGSQLLLTASLKSLQQNNILTTVSPEFDLDNFIITPTDISFTITKEYPFNIAFDKSAAATTIEAADDIEEDKAFADIINFRYLPPVFKLEDSPSTEPMPKLGSYSQLSPPPWTQEEITEKIKKLNDTTGWKITFPETSYQNNNILQFFEFSQTGGIKKLTMVEGPTMYMKLPQTPKPDSANQTTTSDNSSLSGNYIRMLFVGKLFMDRKNAPTFINMFTIVLTNSKTWPEQKMPNQQ
jgi:hypothetical protein